MRFFLLHIFCIFFLSSACDRTSEQLYASETHNIDSTAAIKTIPLPDAPIQNPLKTRKLKLLITNNFNTFFLYKGENFGLEYELLQLFLKSKHIDLEIELIKDVEYIRDSLYARGAHMAAAAFIEPKNKLARVLYSDPIYTTDLVLVKHKDNIASSSNPIVIEDAPYVRRLWSTDTTVLTNIERRYSTQQVSQQKLLTQVHSKEIESTIVDANEASIANAFYPDIVIDRILEHDAPVVFMFHSKMDTLQAEFNSWLMPNTAYHHSHITKKQLFIPSYNIKAGTHYIHWLERNFFNDSTMLESEKEKMISAAYNAGAGHVSDAQALCRKYHLDPYVWEGNVEKMILAKSQPKYYNDPVCKHGYCRGQETSTYVKNILFYYKNYSMYFKE